IILNGRIINNITISTAIHNCYSRYLMKRCYPAITLKIDMPCDEVDVNVHPSKTDVRFADNNKIFGFIYSSIKNVLDNYQRTQALQFCKESEKVAADCDIACNDILNSPAEVSKIFDSVQQDRTKDISNSNNEANYSKVIDNSGKAIDYGNKSNNNDKKNYEVDNSNVIHNNSNINYKAQPYTAEKSVFDRSFPQNSNSTTFGVSENESGIFERMKELFYSTKSASVLANKQEELSQRSIDINYGYRIVGQLFGTYLLIEANRELIIIDQHAAAERVLFERLLAEYNKGEIAIQPMLVPYVFNVNHIEFAMLSELSDKIDLLNDIGIDIEPFGNNSFKISAVPAELVDMDFEKLVRTILDDSKDSYSVDLIREKLIFAACRSAIKGNTVLTDEAIKMLFSSLFDKELPSQCPHGRPAYVKLGKSELEKMFKRIV
ncbi:MAG: hypothetical protein EOM87_09205, partial [Clostridia bacterium]|nr:hypothetical protein [Clostridia bacterium]